MTDLNRENEWLASAGLNVTMGDLSAERSPLADNLVYATHHAVRAEQHLDAKAEWVAKDVTQLRDRLKQPNVIVNNLGEAQGSQQLTAMCGRYAAAANAFEYAAAIYKNATT